MTLELMIYSTYKRTSKYNYAVYPKAQIIRNTCWASTNDHLFSLRFDSGYLQWRDSEEDEDNGDDVYSTKWLNNRISGILH